MANFEPVRIGGWTFEDPIAEDHITGIQEMLVKTANFSEGSSHSPSGIVSVGGAGIWHSNPIQLVTVSNTLVYADQASFLVIGMSSGYTARIANTRSIGGAIPDGTALFVVNNSAAQAWLHREDASAICQLPAATTGPSVTSMAIVWRTGGTWGLFWGSNGVY